MPSTTTPTRTAVPGADEQLSPTIDHSIGVLSRGNVVRTRPSGPVLLARAGKRRRLRPDTFRPLLATRDRILIATLTAGWLLSLVFFWTWWLQPTHRASWWGLALNSALLTYLSGQLVYFFVAVNRLRDVNPALSAPELRVAFVVTRAPSKPWSIARATLCAMLSQDWRSPYDVWLCDENPTIEIRRWCVTYGVKVSSRHGVAAYQRPVWPRREKCKEGNLAYFYDNWGYDHYDVVAQLDCDHVPHQTYLSEITRAFADPAVGYVAAPSISDANSDVSWSARGRLHQEAALHGPVQAGHAEGLAPVCIGSHYAVRTQALRDIGGVGPELAEDFSTSFLLNSAGWQGAFALEAEAHGDGPLTFSAMTTQEYQWARSLTSALYDMLPRHLGRLPWRLRLRFAFALTYYPFLSVTTLVGLTLPPVAAITGLAWIKVNYLEFLGHWWLLSVWSVSLTAMLRHRGLLRPRKVPLVSWERWLYALTRWPFIVSGVMAATVQKIRPRRQVLKVTPKFRNGLERLRLRLILPFVAISVTLACAAVVGELSSNPPGYVFLCIVGAGWNAVVALLVTGLHAVETSRAADMRVRSVLLPTVAPPLLAAVAALAPLATAVALFPAFVTRSFGW